MDNPDPNKLASLENQAEQMLMNAIQMSEAGMDLREKSIIGEKYICSLSNIAGNANEFISEMQSCSKEFARFAQKLCTSAIKNIDSILESDQSFLDLKDEYERLLSILQQEIGDITEQEPNDGATAPDMYVPCMMNVSLIDERIKNLEDKQKLVDYPLSGQSVSSVRSLKLDIDEKYPESWSRESLGDLDSIINLPSVPEDMFANSSRPNRSASLCSLKSLRKVKLILHRALSSDEDDEFEFDDQDLYLSDENNSSDNEVKTRREDDVKQKKSPMLSFISEEGYQD